MRVFKLKSLSVKYIAYLLLSIFTLTARAASEAKHPNEYAVASAHPLATNVGLQVLAKGGNAFDAAVAVSAALAVVEPYHSGLGGGGFWLLHEAKGNTNWLVDGREAAPLKATKDMFLGKDGQVIAQLSLNGGLSAAIPGEPAALVLIAKKFGRLPLKETLAPAIKLAEEGFIVDHQLNYFLSMQDRLQQIRTYPATRAIFLKDNRPYALGERLIQKDLAKTLKKIVDDGHDGFYRGVVASALVEGVRHAGGIWTLQDLASYQAKIRQPLEGDYHNMHVITAPLPSAGGITLLLMLNILSSYPLEYLTKLEQVHLIAESMRLSFWQRMELLADADFVDVPIQKILSQENSQELRAMIHQTAATPSRTLTNKTLDDEHNSNTTHFSIIDTAGNRVAATLSVNFIFGSSLVASGTGVLLNDEMDDFSINPSVKNVFGLMGGSKNTIEPGKRPLSSMTPTFLESPGRVAILGTPGGSRIPSMVLLATLAFSRSFGAITMVSDMRFHHQYLPDLLQFEPDTFSEAFQEKLKIMGYHLMPLAEYFGSMQVITWDKKTNLVTAASDPRRLGLAASVGPKNGKGYGFMH
jgi:gamma-glutamyltranspeptidase/glutathione hydrolase